MKFHELWMCTERMHRRTPAPIGVSALSSVLSDGRSFSCTLVLSSHPPCTAFLRLRAPRAYFPAEHPPSHASRGTSRLLVKTHIVCGPRSSYAAPPTSHTLASSFLSLAPRLHVACQYTRVHFPSAPLVSLPSPGAAYLPMSSSCYLSSATARRRPRTLGTQLPVSTSPRARRHRPCLTRLESHLSGRALRAFGTVQRHPSETISAGALLRSAYLPPPIVSALPMSSWNSRRPPVVSDHASRRDICRPTLPGTCPAW